MAGAGVSVSSAIGLGRIGASTGNLRLLADRLESRVSTMNEGTASRSTSAHHGRELQNSPRSIAAVISSTVIVLVVIRCLAQISVASVPPPASIVSGWMGFPSKFSLSSASITNALRLGEPLWIRRYHNSTESPVELTISLYQAGTLWGNKRAEEVRLAEDFARQMLGIKEQVRGYRATNEEDQAAVDFLERFSRATQPLTRADGRKIYFGAVPGQGGSLSEGFTFHPKFDLVVSLAFVKEDGVPPEKRRRDWIMPTNDLRTVFVRVEEYLEKNRASTNK